MRTVPVFLLLASLCCSAWGAPTKAASDEIEHLFAYLGKSGCEFARNGTWFSAKRAVEHLRSKYENLQKRGVVTTDESFTAESFIDQVASHSNVSGHPYLIRCGNNPAMETGPWFREELLRFREATRLTPNYSLERAAATGFGAIMRWLPANPTGTLHTDVNVGKDPIEVMVVEAKDDN